MPFHKTVGLFAIGVCLTNFSLPAAHADSVDGTAFIRNLLHKEIRKGEKDCGKSLRGTASCEIKLRKILFSKKNSDTANIEIISDVSIKAKLLVDAGAMAEVKARAEYQLKGCTINVVNISKKITKLSGMARYLKPFKSSISKIKVPTGRQPIKNNSIRDNADRYLTSKLKLASSKTPANCEG